MPRAGEIPRAKPACVPSTYLPEGGPMSATATRVQLSTSRRPNFNSPRRTPTPPAVAPLESAPHNLPPRGRRDDTRAPKEHEILFQKFFRSVGPRTYAAQVKRATNGNHYLVLTEGKRDEKTGDVRKCRVFVYSEDFVELFRLIKAAAEFIKDNP